LIDTIPRDQLIVERFENLVLNYDESVARVESFLGLSTSQHRRKRRYFDPEWSASNIGIYKNINVPGLNSSILEELIDWYKRH
jgi:hypothetical protein